MFYGNFAINKQIFRKYSIFTIKTIILNTKFLFSPIMKTKVKSKVYEILLVEDNPGDIDCARQIIVDGKQSCNLNIVNKGKESLSFLQRKGKYSKAPKKVDMVLISMRLPDMSGMDVLHEIRKNKSFKSLPVVVLTTSQITADALKNFEADVFDFATKPLTDDYFNKLLTSLSKIRSLN